jgi:hypothetical protein
MDVVEQGREDHTVSHRWLRGSALVVVALAVLVVTRPRLLSADRPLVDRPTAPPVARFVPKGQNTSQGISLVVRQGDHLERYEAGSGRWPLATLPRGLSRPIPFVHAPGPDGAGPLVGVVDSELFRVSPVHRADPVRPIGRAARVLAASPVPGRLFVLRLPSGAEGSQVVEVDAWTGRRTDGRPFPGYDGAGSWQPAYVLSAGGHSRALLLTRPAGAVRLQLALAWDRDSVQSGRAPALAFIGSAAQLLGVAPARILTIDRPESCVNGGCPITVLTVSPVGVQKMAVQAPVGWSFGSTVVGGDGGDPLAVVSRIDDSANLALARLRVGARRGLLIAGSQGFAGSVRPMTGPQGSVLFAARRPEGQRLMVWLSGSPSAALLLDLPALKAGAELVCACR